VPKTYDINQIDLIAAIGKHLERRHRVKEVIPRHFNAIIAAANVIVEEFARPETAAVPNSGLASWLASDDTGISSRTIAWVCAGAYKPDFESHPLDATDFGRCVRLLDSAPEIRKSLHKMKEKGPEWSALVEHWDELEALYRAKKSNELSWRMDVLLTPARA
jgi:hypothetical protein